MTKNTVIWLNYYFDLLRDINKQLIKVVGMECVNNYMIVRQEFCELIQKILMITPCTLGKNTNTLELATDDGIFTFYDDFNFLKNEIKTLIDSHNETYKKMKRIRNKYEHEFHFVSFYGASSGSEQATSVHLKYDNQKQTKDIIEITGNELILTLKDINILFDKIMENALDFIQNCDDNDFRYVYESKYYRIVFGDYNEIYDSKSLIKISRAIN